MKNTDRRLLERTVTVGGWKLEHDKKKVSVPVGEKLCAEIVRLVDIAEIHGTRMGVCLDLLTKHSFTGNSLLFSLRAERDTRQKQSIDAYKGIDIRLSQGVIIEDQPYVIDTIVGCDNRDNTPITLVGGRKIKHWLNQGIPGFKSAPEVPRGLPYFENVAEVLPQIEALCPITEDGIQKELSAHFVGTITNK